MSDENCLFAYVNLICDTIMGNIKTSHSFFKRKVDNEEICDENQEIKHHKASTIKGFDNWKKVNDGKNGAFLKHIRYSQQRNNVAFAENLMNQESHIENIIVKQNEAQILKNRLRVKASIDTARWLTFQVCALRGHDESPNFQNCEGIIRESFLDLVQVRVTLSLTLKTNMRRQLLHYQFDVSKICGQGYDGASNMRGEWNGLQALVLKDLCASSKCHDELQKAKATKIEQLLELGEIESGGVKHPSFDRKAISNGRHDFELSVIRLCDAAWKEVDQRALLILQSSLSEEAMAETLGLVTAHEIWKALEQAYSHDSRERLTTRIVHYADDNFELFPDGLSSLKPIPTYVVLLYIPSKTNPKGIFA
ncbi:uncharacterized protein LOC128126981 [Lactuca sativa]|uniref:uncharacterized protein LOC128126981 n=1 Tax=Lactuca sativa TaxID=4236 RepID=UPI0022B010EC|nr:uncharacterized protein LOC128126981 [Lactuca sativa]